MKELWYMLPGATSLRLCVISVARRQTHCVQLPRLKKLATFHVTWGTSFGLRSTMLLPKLAYGAVTPTNVRAIKLEEILNSSFSI